MHLQLLAHVTHVEVGSGLLIYAVGLVSGLLAARLLGLARTAVPRPVRSQSQRP